MTIRTNIYKMRKRIKDEDLLKIKKIIDDEIERRTENDKRTMKNSKGVE